MRSLVVAPLVLAALLAGVSAGSLSGSVTDVAAAPEPTSTISGVLKHPGGGPYTAGGTGDVLGDDGRVVTSFEIQPDGSYATPGLPAGTYRLRFDPRGPGVYEEYYRNRITLAGADPITVSDGEDVTGADMQLTLAASVTGRVRRADGTPVVGATVTAYDEADVVRGSDRTSSTGRYQIMGLPAGDVRIGFAGDYVAPQFYANRARLASATPVHLTPGTTFVGVDARMHTAGTITGTVRGGRSGNPMGNVKVHLVREDGLRAGPFLTSSPSGSYTASGLRPGQWRVAFVPPSGLSLTEYYSNSPTLAGATLVTVTAGQTTGNVDETLPLAALIEGKVTNADGNPIAGVKASAYDEAGEVVSSRTTDANGFYRLGWLRTGSYRVGFDAPDAYLDEFREDVAATQGSTTRLNATLTRAARISGLVTDESRGAIPGTVVKAYDGFGAVARSTVVGATGQYTLSQLRAGVYRVGFEPPDGSGFQAEFYDDKAQLADADGVWLFAGSTAPAIDAELALD